MIEILCNIHECIQRRINIEYSVHLIYIRYIYSVYFPYIHNQRIFCKPAYSITCAKGSNCSMEIIIN